MDSMNEKACEACEFYKAYWFTHAVKAGIDTDVARAMAQAVSTAWMAGYLYAERHVAAEPQRTEKEARDEVSRFVEDALEASRKLYRDGSLEFTGK